MSSLTLSNFKFNPKLAAQISATAAEKITAYILPKTVRARENLEADDLAKIKTLN